MRVLAERCDYRWLVTIFSILTLIVAWGWTCHSEAALAPTFTFTETPATSETPTISPTPSESHTISATPSVTATPTIILTASVTPTPLMGPFLLQEEFSSTTLDPAWQVVIIPGYGSYSLSENPGFLRYHLEGNRGHSDGWYTDYTNNINGWSPTTTLIRTFQGDHWTLYTRAYFSLHCNNGMDSSGAQTACLWIAFGNENNNWLKISRGVDYAYASNLIEYQNKNTGGPIPLTYTVIECAPNDTNKAGWYQYTYYFQIERDGQNVSAAVSYDGIYFTPMANAFTLPSTIEGTQRIILDSIIWTSAGSVADWDYFIATAPTATPTTTPTITHTPTPQPTAVLKEPFIQNGYAAPNPFLPRQGQKTYFNVYIGNPPVNYKITIFDLKGHLRRKLTNMDNWDGRDEAGRLCEGGVYLFQIEVAGKRVSGKVVIIK